MTTELANDVTGAPPVRSSDWLDAIVCADCLSVLSELPDKSVAVTITDPPYSITSNKWDVPFDVQAWWKEIRRVTVGAVVMTASQPFTAMMVMSNLKNFQCEWIWHKSKPSGVAFKKQPMRNHESVLVFESVSTFNAAPEQREGFTAASIKRFKSGKNFGSYRNHGNSTTGMAETELKPISLMRKPTTVKRFASVPNRLGTMHPTQKPVELMRYLVLTYTNVGDTILDPFCGSGTTCIAAMQEGRHYIGIEKETNYAEISKQRIYEARGLGV